jgi:flagellar basal-body rod modification protein FlgD
MSVNPINSSSQPNPNASQSSNPVTNPLANQNIFLQLLVAQLKNQDPQNPADGTQFITQLAQFSELSNTTQMTSDLDAIRQALASAASGGSATPGDVKTP